MLFRCVGVLHPILLQYVCLLLYYDITSHPPPQSKPHDTIGGVLAENETQSTNYIQDKKTQNVGMNSTIFETCFLKLNQLSLFRMTDH